MGDGCEGDDGSRRDAAKPHPIVDARAAIRVNGTSQAAEQDALKRGRMQ